MDPTLEQAAEVLVLWYSLGTWTGRPSVSGVRVVDIHARIADEELAEATSEPYVLFFEPTPLPTVNDFDPIALAMRINRLGASKPLRLVAFASYPSLTPFDTQCAFAAQVGDILGVDPEIQRVVVDTRWRPVGASGKKHPGPDATPQPIDLGPEVDWQRALDAAVLGKQKVERLEPRTRLLVTSYLSSMRSGPRFNPTQRRLLHRASTGDISVTAEDVSEALHVSHVTAQRAIRGIAACLFDEESGRRAPELVGRVVISYAIFLRYNEFT